VLHILTSWNWHWLWYFTSTYSQLLEVWSWDMASKQIVKMWWLKLVPWKLVNKNGASHPRKHLTAGIGFGDLYQHHCIGFVLCISILAEVLFISIFNVQRRLSCYTSASWQFVEVEWQYWSNLTACRGCGAVDKLNGLRQPLCCHILAPTAVAR
jgi:hypothetical protein